ncbi:glycosyltransferase family 8 protein [Candidatus Saccharibacteria bacterium]|nr:glycosyltransferase family 8 protein [Candidatus Saccharibacteria bacterium]
MNILYCGDKGIVRGVLVSILSLLMRGDENAIYNIYILTIKYEETKPFTEEAANFLDRLVKKHNKKSFVKLIDATEVFVKNLPKKNMRSYFTPASMLRLYIDKVPELAQLDRILYLDYDVVCRGDISEFYNMDLTGVEAAGVLDIYGRRWYHYHGLLKQDYMNSGVMLFNIPECIKTGMFGKAVELCAGRWMMLADQAALNKSIEKRVLVDRKYNEQEEKPRRDTVLHHFSNNFKFWPFFRVQKVKPFEVEKVHEVLGIHEYDDILNEYERLKDSVED